MLLKKKSQQTQTKPALLLIAEGKSCPWRNAALGTKAKPWSWSCHGTELGVGTAWTGATRTCHSCPPRVTFHCHHERKSSTEQHVPKLGPDTDRLGHNTPKLETQRPHKTGGNNEEPTLPKGHLQSQGCHPPADEVPPPQLLSWEAGNMMGKDGVEKKNRYLGTGLCPHADSGSPKVKK